MKRKNQLFSLLLSGLLVCGLLNPVNSHAAEIEYVNHTSTGAMELNVEYEVYDTFEVSVPKKIELVKSNDVSIPVGVKGDLASKSTLDITPAETMTLSQDTKDPIVVDVMINKGSFNFQELEGDGQNTGIVIDATNLTAGEWKGTCTLTVAVTDHTND